MNKEFYIDSNKAIINFTFKYCNNFEEVLSSKSFRRILNLFIKKETDKKVNKYINILNIFNVKSDKERTDEFIKFLKLLSVLNLRELSDLDIKYKEINNNKKELLLFIEGLYSFWRKLERYTIINNNKKENSITTINFNEINVKFCKLILELYRKIEKNIMDKDLNVFREISAGGNACIIIKRINWNIPLEYNNLKKVSFIQKVSIQTPFIAYPKKNKRDGTFKEVNNNPIMCYNIDPNKWFCYPAKVGNLLGFIYFHRDFMSHGISLCNLFELANEENYINKKPDIIYVFGLEQMKNFEVNFFEDKKNNILLGYASNSINIDYFGYMKKMALTLHNLVMIRKKALPIHGAMVSVTLNNGKNSNIIIVGDSGTGKSESLEAFRSLGEKYISDMKIIFDDMGVLNIENNQIRAYGTEIGAFVRLDDLDQGYAFKELDRSIFMNPDKVNARLIMPISDYDDIIKGFPIDMILYANNYEKLNHDENSIIYLSNVSEAVNIFKAAKRMAKGTTTEYGLVNSYFANPFGPLQRVKDVDKLINFYFKKIFEKGIKVGVVKTQLAVDGMEKEGPLKVAIELMNIINKN